MLPDDDIILTLWYAVEKSLAGKDGKHYQAKLSLSETILCGVLFVLMGRSFRRYYRWLVKRGLFLSLPERSRLHRLINHYSYLCEEFLGSTTFYGILDSFGIEVIHPIREGRSEESGIRKREIKSPMDSGKKSSDNNQPELRNSKNE